MTKTGIHLATIALLIALYSTTSTATYIPEPLDTPSDATQSPQTATSTETRSTDRTPDIYRVQSHESLSLVRMVIEEAEQAGVDPRKALYMARGESTMNPNATGDMHLTCPHTGKPFRSRGLFQLSTCFYGDVSDAEAYDPVANTRKAMEIISKGERHCRSQFTTCERWYSRK